MSKFLKPYLACLSSGLFSANNLIAFSLLNVVSKGIEIDLNLNSFQLGIFSSTFLFANAFGLIGIGVLLDKYTLRPIAITLMLIAALASFGLSQTSSFTLCILFRLMQGLASAGSLLIATRIASSWFPKNSAFAIGSIIALALCGGVFGNNIAVFLPHARSWRQLMLFSSAIGGVILIIMYLFLFDNKSDKLPSSAKFLPKKIFSLIKQKHILLIGSYIGLMNFPVFILAGLWANMYLTHQFKLTQFQASQSASLIFVGVIIGAPVYGFLSDFFNNRIIFMLIGAVLALLISLYMISISTLNATIADILFFSLGFVCSSQILGYAFIAEKYTISIRSTAIAFVCLLENLIGGLGQISFGYLISVNTTAYYNHAITLFIMSFLLSALIICFSKQLTPTERATIIRK